MYLFKKGNTIFIWSNPLNVDQYIDYPINMAKKHYKEKHNLKGIIKRVNYCPFIVY